MQLFIFVLIFCFVVFLFRLYHLAVDDYVLIKKNITLEDVFNAAFVIALPSLLFARFFYVIFHPAHVFLNPLGFLLFPYYPGLSLSGGILGGAISLFVYASYGKFPKARIFDFFTISLLFSIPFGLIGFVILSHFTSGIGIKMLLFAIMFILTSVYLYPKSSALEIKDGSLSFLFLMFFSLISLLANSIDNPGIRNFIDNKENFLLIALLITSVVFVVKQEILGRISLGK